MKYLFENVTVTVPRVSFWGFVVSFICLFAAAAMQLLGWA